ncbi:MAG: hypothetical protein HY033_04815 [Ignavibacteriae bacterium]|nr:hypothetical protein [Ignavibacteria bacterium]MBI3364211.1 hypothetical protein [Ignavibacteriota bacterium]
MRKKKTHILILDKGDPEKESKRVIDEHEQYIPLSDCKHGWLYKIRSRNLTAGVFREDRKGFVGIREKFGCEYLFTEFHWDTGAPFGTVKPNRRLEQCPLENLDEYCERESGKPEVNKPLFDWLMEKEGEHIGPRKITSKQPSAIFLFSGRRD